MLKFTVEIFILVVFASILTIFQHMVFVDGFLILVEELELLTNLGQWIRDLDVLTGEIDRPPIGRVEPVRGCLNNPSRLVWTTMTSLTAPLAALRSPKEAKEKS